MKLEVGTDFYTSLHYEERDKFQLQKCQILQIVHDRLFTFINYEDGYIYDYYNGIVYRDGNTVAYCPLIITDVERTKLLTYTEEQVRSVLLDMRDELIRATNSIVLMNTVWKENKWLKFLPNKQFNRLNSYRLYKKLVRTVEESFGIVWRHELDV